jgi:hypothetical protein
MIRKLIRFGILAGVSCGFSFGSSLIENGDFAKPLKPWKVFSLKETPATEVALAEGILTIKAVGASDKPANRQMAQVLKLESGKKYKLEFEAKAALDEGKELTLVLVHSIDSKKPNYGLWRKLELTPEWKTHTVHFTSKEIDPSDAPVLKFLMGTMKGEISFRKVVLTEVQGGGKKETAN